MDRTISLLYLAIIDASVLICDLLLEELLQRLFAGQYGFVLAGKDLRIIFRQSHFHNRVVLVSAKDNADGRIFLRQPQKLQDIGIFHGILRRFYGLPFQCQPLNLFLIRTECKPLIEGAVVLPLQLAEAPIVFHRLDFIKMPFLDIVNAHELQIV